MSIPKEAIKAAAGAIRCLWSMPMEGHPTAPECTLCRSTAERMLEAAAPMIAAQVLHEAADDFRHYKTPNARLYLRARAARLEAPSE